MSWSTLRLKCALSLFVFSFSLSAHAFEPRMSVTVETSLTPCSMASRIF